MALNSAPVYLSTFLMERNRWNGKGPSLLVSDWIEFIGEAGFRGVEIWAPHLLFASRSEWEILREKSRDADVPVVFLNAKFPTDASDKSRRQRESLLEAAGYFSPRGVKFDLGGGDFAEKLQFLADWARDLPRDVHCVYPFGGTPSTLAEYAACRQKIGSRFRCSLNVFSADAASLEELFLKSAGAIVNLDVDAVKDGRYRSLRDAEGVLEPLIALLRRLDYQGSWTLRGTAGMGEPGEDIERLFDGAEEDLNFLAAALSGKQPGI